MKKPLYFISFLLVILQTGCDAQQPAGPVVFLEKISSGFTSPVGMACPDDGTDRIFVFEQGGKIFVVSNGSVSKEPFIDISARLDGLNIAYSEKGLLGMAFHPDYKNNRRFFLYYSAPANVRGVDHKSVLAEFLTDPVNPSKAIDSPITVLEFFQPESNHNGGMLEFGPDGFLYVGTGDGGGANDEHGTIGNSQDRSNLLGKILRIDVDGARPYSIPADNPFRNTAGARPEIYAYGLRNPWRFSFDSQTGELFCGDVGQNKYEEINIIRKGGNYGWRIMEGYHCFNPPAGCNTSGLILPIDEYDHDVGISICGGYMYRENIYPSLRGWYFFGDWSGKLFALRKMNDGTWKRFNCDVNSTGKNEIDGKLNSMGIDQKGNIYLLTQKLFGPKSPTGVLYKITSK
jgi:glucose/arabinose dehydrogenase